MIKCEDKCFHLSSKCSCCHVSTRALPEDVPSCFHRKVQIVCPTNWNIWNGHCKMCLSHSKRAKRQMLSNLVCPSCETQFAIFIAEIKINNQSIFKTSLLHVSEISVMLNTSSVDIITSLLSNPSV